MEQRSLTDDLRKQIAWLQDYERYGGRMTPPRAYAILIVLENALDRILAQQSQLDIYEQERRTHHDRQDRL